MTPEESSAHGSATTPQDAAVAIIKQEHRTLGTVIEVLQRLLHDVAAEHGQPDFVLLSAALCYIDDFPERNHHPKEDLVLFEALRRRTSEFHTVVDELRNEHVSSERMVHEMHRTLVHYQAGAAGALHVLKSRVDAYAALLREHMRKEEALLEKARGCLTEADWRDIADAFASNDDPLLGDHGPEELRKLRLRIINRLPSKIRQSWRHDD